MPVQFSSRLGTDTSSVKKIVFGKEFVEIGFQRTNALLKSSQLFLSASSDMQAYRLLHFVYTAFSNTIRGWVHRHCVEFIPPGSMEHVGSKLIHLAATNLSTGGHYNTNSVVFTTSGRTKVGVHWNLYRELMNGNKAWLKMAKEESKKLTSPSMCFS